MKNHGETSRRQFTKAIVTAAIAVPVLSSVTNCNQRPEQRTEPKTTPDDGPKITSCFGVSAGSGTITEHIPPIGIDGGSGSLIIETHNKLSRRPGPTR